MMAVQYCSQYLVHHLFARCTHMITPSKTTTNLLCDHTVFSNCARLFVYL